MAGGLSIEEEQRAGNVSASSPPLKRLTQRPLVFEVKQKGRKIVTGHFVLFFLYHDTETANFAIHVRKKLGGAVARNRVKRVFRAALLQLSGMIRGVNLILVPRQGGIGLGASEVASLLEKCFAEAGIGQKR